MGDSDGIELVKVVNEVLISSKWSISDVINIIMLITVIIGGGFAFYKWNEERKLKRSEYIFSLIEFIRTDQIIMECFNTIEYSKSWYNSNFHECAECENKFDRFFSFFSYICYLKEKKIIKKDEFDFLKYDVTRVIKNEDVQNYFYNLYHWAKKSGTPMSFYPLLKYGEKNRLIPKDFFDADSHKSENSRFSKHLNF